MRLVDELKRRNVFRIAGTYCVVAFAMVELVPNLADAFGLPDWSTTFVFFMLALCFPIVILITWAFEMTPEGLRRTEEVDQHRQVVVASAKIGDYVLLVAILAAVGYMAYSVNLREASSAGVGEVTAINTIAVLPFANLSVEPEQEGMSQAITTDVRNRLTKLSSLKVVAGPASQKPGEEADLGEIGKKLRAPVVLDGSVQRSGAKLRVMAQLIDTENGVQLWSKTFDREMADMLSVQDDVAQSIVDDIRDVIMPPAVEVSAEESSVRTRKLMDEARARLAQRTEESLNAATASFEQAIMRDPKSAPAYAALAEAVLLQGETWETYGQIPLADAVARARPFAAKALKLDPALAEASAVMGLVELASGDTASAIDNLSAAIERNPDLAKAHLWLYQAYAAEGRLAEGIARLGKAHELDPGSLAIGLNMSRLLAITDRRLEADTLLDGLERLYPGNENLLAARGARLADDWRPVDAIQVLRQASKADPSDAKVKAMLGLAYLDLGATGEAEAWFDEGKAVILLAQGRTQEALAEARRRFAADPGNPDRLFALADAEAAAGHHRAVIDMLAPFEALSKNGAGPLYGRSPIAMPAMTLAGARLALNDAAGARPLLDGARAWLEGQRALGFEHPSLAYVEARIDALDGKPDQAMAALRRAVSRRFAGVSVVGWDPALASLRTLTDYRALVADLDADRGQGRARLKDMGLLASL